MDFLSRTVLLPLAQALPKAVSPLDQLKAVDLTTVLISAVAGTVFSIVAYWIASKIVAHEEHATFKNALKIWGLSLVVGFVFALTCGIAVPIAALSGNSTAVAVVILGALLLAVVLMFALPMKVLEITPLRALGFWPIAMILMFAGQAGLDQALGREPLGEWNQAMAFLQSNVTGGNSSGVEAELTRLSQPVERKKPFEKRQEHLRAVFVQLQAQQRALRPGDTAARVTYERQLLRYEELLRVLRADYAASQTRAAP